MANRYFAGNTLAAFLREGVDVVEVTTASRFDSAFVPSCIQLPGTGTPNGVQTPEFNATGTVWLHYELWTVNGSSSNEVLLLRNGSTSIFRLVMVSGSTYRAEYWNGSAWVATGTTQSWPSSVLNRYDLKITLNSGFELYLGGTLITSGSGWSGGPTTMTNARWRAGGSGNANFLSQVMIADYDLRDSRYMAAALNGDSAANTDGTGAYTTVNETVLDESTSVSLATSGHKRGQTHAAITVPAGYVIGALAMAARGRATGTITDGKLGVRSGGANYSSAGKGFTGGYEPRVHILENDPATATRFTEAGFNAAETYLEAA